MLEQLKQMNDELAQLKAKHLEMSKVMFKDVAAKLFEKHPLLLSFGWVQYTPYFNDGDECVFSARVESPDINGYNDDYGWEGTGINLIKDSKKFITEKITNEAELQENLQYYKEAGYDWLGNRKIGDYGVRLNPNYNPEHGQAVKDVKDFLSEIDESVLRGMFGDHVRITVTRHGVDVGEYDHD